MGGKSSKKKDGEEEDGKKEPKKDPNEEKLSAPEGFDGPGKNRKCTDVLFLLLICANWVAMTMVGGIVLGYIENDRLPPGDPRRLINGMDYLGQICAVDTKTRLSNETSTGKYFTGYSYDSYETAEYKKYKVSNLPKAYFLLTGEAVCVKKCPTADDYDRFICKYGVREELDAFRDAGDYEGYYYRGIQAVKDYQCSQVFETTDYIGYCVFSATPPAYSAALMGGAPRAWPDPTSVPTPAPSYPPTPMPTGPSAMPTPMPTWVWNNTVPCSEGSAEMCQTQYAQCETLFCPDCILPGFCDFTCGFCSPPPTPAPTTLDFMLANREADTDSSFLTAIVADLYTSYSYILGIGLGASTFIGFVYLRLLRIPCVLFLMVWSIIAAIFFCLCGAGYMVLTTAKEWEAEDPPLHTDDEVKLCTYVGYGFCGLAALYFCVICVLRKRIMLALGVVKEAARAVGALWLLTVFPVIQCAGLLCFMVPWLIYCFYLASSATIKTQQVSFGDDGMTVTTKDFEYSEDQKYAALYLLFCFFWSSEFIVALGQIVVALAVATWYFAKEKSALKGTSGAPAVLRAICIAFFKHAGSAAFGSLIIAIIKTIRAVIAYLQNEAKKSGNKLAMLVLAVIQCCMYCVEKCMKFMNQTAYIQIAIFGISFCAAAKRAFFLILRNILRIAAVSIVSTFVLILGKIFITIATAMLFYYVVTKELGDQMNGIFFPTFLTTGCAFFAASMFNEVFGMAIWTILQCFVADEEMFPDPNDRYAEGSLAALIGKTSKADISASKPACCCCRKKRTKKHDAMLKKKFEEADSDGSGVIDKDELKALLAKVTGEAPSDDEVEKMMKSVDSSGDGTIDFKEFCGIYEKAINNELEFDALKKTMGAFDDLLAEIDVEDDDKGDKDKEK